MKGLKKIAPFLIVRHFSFMDLSIEPKLSRQLRNVGIRIPTDIQKLSIPVLLDGKSCVINSETGSGKTLAYSIPLIQKILQGRKNIERRPFGMILVPNNELAFQVHNVIKQLEIVKPSVATEFSMLNLKSTDIIVSTPSHINTYPLSAFDNIKTLIVDEADFQIGRKVGKHGTKDPLFKIIHHFLDEKILKTKDRLKITSSTLADPIDFKEEDKKHTQFIFVGATMPDSSSIKSKSALPYIRSWLPNIHVIKNDSAHKIVSRSKMEFINVLQGNKLKLLLQTLNHNENVNKKIIVFANKVDTVNYLYKNLITYSGDSLNKMEGISSRTRYQLKEKLFYCHSKQSLTERMKIIDEFSHIESGVLISSDIISRGVDIPNVDIVIQYDFATNIIDALHRAGRTARIYQEGEVINFVTLEEEVIAKAFQEAFNNNEQLDNLFSRKRSLGKRLLSHVESSISSTDF